MFSSNLSFCDRALNIESGSIWAKFQIIQNTYKISNQHFIVAECCRSSILFRKGSFFIKFYLCSLLNKYVRFEKCNDSDNAKNEFDQYIHVIFIGTEIWQGIKKVVCTVR